MDQRSIATFRLSVLALWAALLSLVSLSVVADEPTEIDYTCDPNFDYANPKLPGSCPGEKIQDGVCDNPNHGGDDPLCVEQDCIDCNKFCKLEVMLVKARLHMLLYSGRPLSLTSSALFLSSL